MNYLEWDGLTGAEASGGDLWETIMGKAEPELGKALSTRPRRLLFSSWKVVDGFSFMVEDGG